MTHQITHQATLDVMTAFGDAFNRHDLDGIMACMTDDCILITFGGKRYEGSRAVRERFSNRLQEVPDLHYEETDHFICGDRGFYKWNATSTENGTSVKYVSCDIFTYRDGKIAVKDFYMKWQSG